MNGEVLKLRFDTIPPTATAQQKGVFVRGGRAHFFTKAKVRREEQNVVALVVSRLPEDWEPLTGPLALRLKFVYPYRRSEKKKLVKAGVEIPHDRRPDADNLAKGCVDALATAAIFLDDGQLARMEIEKFWGATPYWEVSVGRLVPEIAASGPSFAQVAPEGSGR